MENDATADFVLQAIHGSGRYRTRNLCPPPITTATAISILYLCIGFWQIRRGSEGRIAVGFVYHDANDGGANVLYRNDIGTGGGGSWQFTDVTRQTGLDQHNRRHSLAAAWEDYDNDGDLDLYVANDYGRNCLYRNDGGHFVDVAPEAGVVDFGSGMSVSWGDYNRDGWMDLYVGNMFSSAGNRITRQDRFKAGADDGLRAIYSRFAKGNSLFRTTGQARSRRSGPPRPWKWDAGPGAACSRI